MSATSIARVLGRRVFDSRGRPTVEAQIELDGGAIGRAIAPSGASRGSNEAIELRDGGTRFGGFDVTRALANVEGPIAAALRGADALDQSRVDALMVAADGTANKARLGGNAIVAVSLAVAHAAAAAQRVPLWRHIAAGRDVTLPMPEIQIFGGGAHAGRRIDIQDLMVIPIGAQSLDEAFAIVSDVYRAAGALMRDAGKLAGVADEGGYWPAFDSNEEALGMLTRAIEAAHHRPGVDVGLSLDVAANELYGSGRYRLSLDRRSVASDELAATLEQWIARFPIVSIEDPFAEDDVAAWQRFTADVGDRVQIVGDDLLVTSATRVDTAAKENLCTAALIKPNQASTLTETLGALDAAKSAGLATIVSARSGETEDVSIAHLAVGSNAGQIKVGSFSRGERMAKWNELIRIAAGLGARARFSGRGALAFR